MCLLRSVKQRILGGGSDAQATTSATATGISKMPIEGMASAVKPQNAAVKAQATAIAPRALRILSAEETNRDTKSGTSRTIKAREPFTPTSVPIHLDTVTDDDSLSPAYMGTVRPTTGNDADQTRATTSANFRTLRDRLPSSMDHSPDRVTVRTSSH